MSSQQPHASETDGAAEAPQHQKTLIVPPHNEIPADVRLTLAMFMRSIHTIGSEIITLAHEWQTAKYQLRFAYADYPAPFKTEWPLLPRHVVSLPQSEAFTSQKFGRLAERVHIFLRAQMPLIARLTDPSDTDHFEDIGHDVFRAFFDRPDLFPMPSPVVSSEAQFWQTDACFADQFLNGCNPTVIQRISSLEQARQIMPSELLACVDDDGRTVQQLIDQNALLVADYAILAEPMIASGVDPHHGSFTNSISFKHIGDPGRMVKHFYAPCAAFYQNAHGRLSVLGISLTRFKDRLNHVYNREMCTNCPNIYTFAKMHVACADNQLHQFYYHLGRCHLVFEPFAVAVRNIFNLNSDSRASNHVVGRLLDPHFEDHIAINWLARNTLVAQSSDAIPFTDAGFALGARGGLTLLANKFKAWRLEDQAFPAQLSTRGFDPHGNDGLHYHYRNDGMLIWGALHRYVAIAISDFYQQHDEPVENDAILQAWCDEMCSRDGAAVRSFPANFTSMEQLTDTVTTIMYNVSAEHSAVNAAQERYLAYVPNRPNALFRPVPAPRDNGDMSLVGEVLSLRRGKGDDDDVGASMPLSFAVFQVHFSHLLSLKPTKTLLELDAKGVSSEAKSQLKEELLAAHHHIKARNEEIQRDHPNYAPYEFLDPADVAQSIEI